MAQIRNFNTTIQTEIAMETLLILKMCQASTFFRLQQL